MINIQQSPQRDFRMSEPGVRRALALDGKTLRGALGVGGRVRLWVPQTRLTSCGLLIFVEEASDPVESADASRVIWPLFWERA